MLISYEKLQNTLVNRPQAAAKLPLDKFS